MITLELWVPKTDQFGILPRSAVVSVKPAAPRQQVTLDYEGARYGGALAASYRERVRHAAGRSIQMYPTAARMTVDRAHLTCVGGIRCDSQVSQLFIDVHDPRALADWLGVMPDQLPRMLAEASEPDPPVAWAGRPVLRALPAKQAFQ